MGKVAILTGANGFIGSNLCQDLSSKYTKVFAVVNPNSENTTMKALSEKLHNIHIIFCDLRYTAEVIAKLSFNADIFYHFASVGVHRADNNPIEINQVNVESFNTILKLATKYYHRLIIAGSGFEYKNPNNALENSDLIASNSANLYARSKKAAFEIAKNHTTLHITWLRMYTIYGQHEDASRLIPYLFTCARQNIRPVLNTPDNIRDFLSVDDFITAVDCIVNSTTSKFDVYNIGSGQGTIVKEIATHIFKLFNRELKWYPNELAQITREDPELFVANIDKLNRLGWTPKVPLNKGLKKLSHEFTI
jgi:UDP-glucose 4-epimerase